MFVGRFPSLLQAGQALLLVGSGQHRSCMCFLHRGVEDVSSLIHMLYFVTWSRKSLAVCCLREVGCKRR